MLGNVQKRTSFGDAGLITLLILLKGTDNSQVGASVSQVSVTSCIKTGGNGMGNLVNVVAKTPQPERPDARPTAEKATTCGA